jgi:coenzyme F420-reducing hydrogenase delta subunit
MSHQQTSDIVIFVCKNCIPQAADLPAQWTDQGMHVRTKEIPCSGKIEVQYMLHALEGGVRGLCIVTCPVGECTLAQGNYRSEMRVNTVKRLLSEIGLDPARAELVHCPAGVTADQFGTIVRDAAHRFAPKAATATPQES